MTFYTGLRDNTAAPLIAQFGRAAVYRVFGAEVYDNATATTSKGSSTDTPIILVKLPVKPQVFSEEVTAKSAAMLLVSAKEFAAAGVTPAVDETILIDTASYRILAILSIDPSGVPVVFKMAVQHA